MNMDDLTRQFTHEEIMKEYTKLCARVGYTPEEMNCFLHSTAFKSCVANDFANAMMEHCEEMKKEKYGWKINPETIKYIVHYAAICVAKQVRIEGKTIKNFRAAQNAVNTNDINKDYLKN